jgi:PAS domain S-box-containing protein
LTAGPGSAAVDHVLTFPHDDHAFRAHVDAARAAVGGWDPARIEAEIRLAYPNAVVRAADQFGQLEVGSRRWYVYRDGGIGSAVSSDEWWRDETLPRTVMTADGRYVDANDAAAELFGCSREAIRAGRAGDFTRHEAGDEVVSRLFATLRDTGRLHSTAVVVRPDGTQWPIEFHVSPVTPAADRYVTVMRRTSA